jgi:hypothetical protein
MSLRRSKLIEIVGGLFILLFTYTATDKLLHNARFYNVLKKAPLIRGQASVISISVPLVEIIIVALLFIPKTRILGLFGSLLLMSAFTAYIAIMLFFSPHLPCSCGGVVSQLGWNEHLIFNSLFIGLAALAIWLSRSRPKNQIMNSMQTFL